MTYTYALLEISPPAFNEIAQKMAKAGSQQAFHDDKEHGKLIDMRGIAVVPDRQMKPGEHYLELRSILSDRVKQGRVELRVDDVVVQMNLDKAREVLGMLSGAIEAAISDQIMFEFLTKKIKLDEQHAGVALLGLRELRQGSSAVVFPS